MERLMTVEEKIRRAEEIYERRKQGNIRQVATVNLNDKKDIKLIKKMLIQILVCVSIYLIIYTVQHNNYIFSNDFIEKVNEVLSYDTNFVKIYDDIKNQVLNIFNVNNKEQIQSNDTETNEKKTEEKQETQDKITESNIDENNQLAIGGADSEKKDDTNTLSEEEQNILNINNTTTFIKPLSGQITSKYGYRDTATGSVPKNHTGTDIAANLGTKIISATDGEVVLSSEEGDYGKHLKIQIGEVSVIYAHCNNLYVNQGDIVKQGQEIAEVGSTGNSTRSTSSF